MNLKWIALCSVVTGVLVCTAPAPPEAFAAHYVGRFIEPPRPGPPLSPQPSWIYDGYWVYSQLGKSVSAGDINGDGFSDIVAGAPTWDTYDIRGGKVFVIAGSPSGLLRSPLNDFGKIQEDSGFGFSVSVVGDINADGFADVVVGAPLFDSPNTDAGRIFIYLGSPSGLQLNRETSIPGGQAGSQFGYAVTGAGDVNGDGYGDVIVGAPWYDAGQTDEGRVLLFLGGPNGLQLAPAWTAEGGQTGAAFGTSLAGAGDINRDGYCDIVISAPRYDGSALDEGAVFVYFGSDTGLGGSPGWTVTGGLRDCRFGNAVAGAGDVDGDGFSDIIIGASEYYTNENYRDGRVYVYRGSPAGIESEPYWELTWSSREHFGYAVATAGDVNGDGLSDILVGCKTAFVTGYREYAFLFLGSASGIASTPAWCAANNESGVQNIGIVASAGDVNGDGFSDVLIGDYLHGGGTTITDGRVLVYHAIPTPARLEEEPTRRFEGALAGEWFGASVAGSGDVNADGRVDILIGAPLSDRGGPDAGAAFMFTGSDTGFSALPQWRADGEELWSRFGHALSPAGDVNGDGFDDVIVGAPRYSNGEADEGAAYLFSGFAGGLKPVPDWIGEGNQVGAEFGFSVARAGDVNGDGFGDVIIGAFRHGGGEPEEGRAYVYYGSPGGLSESLTWSAEGDQAGAWFGYAVAGAGDINNDGFSDVIVGAPYYENGETDEGRVYIYAGSAAGLPDTATWTIEIDREASRLGIAVAAAGDVNRDGFGDIIIGAEGYLFELDDIGSVFVFHGSAAGPGPKPAWSARGDPLTGSLGKALACAGDIDRDGYSDIAIGDPFFDGAATDQGRVVVFTGSSRGLSSYPQWMFEGTSAGERFGNSVAGVGDVNGDGAPDLFVGCPGPAGSGGSRGAGFVYATTGLSRDRFAPRQLRADGFANVGVLGYCGDREEFRIRATAYPPAGASYIYLESETMQRYLPFTAETIHKGAIRRLSVEERISGEAIELEEIIDPARSPWRVHWRVRVCSDAPHAPRSRWLEHAYNVTAESDLRLFLVSPDEAPKPELPIEARPLVIRLESNYPNPFNPATIFSYSLSRPALVALKIYDVLGRAVDTIVGDWQTEGSHRASWDGRDESGARLASGVYFARLEAEGQVRTRKIVLLK